jgi:hypothetical protein
MRGEPRQTTSNIGHIQKPSLVELEQRMLLNLNKVNWGQSLKI